MRSGVRAFALRSGWLAALAVMLATTGARAQETTNTPAATLASPGAYIVRVLGRGYSLARGPAPGSPGGWLLEERLMFATGLAPELAFEAELPLIQSFLDAPDGSDVSRGFGFGDLDLGIKWRFLRHDLGPIDTIRAAVLAGVELPTGTRGFGSSSVDPWVGLAATEILGRHGFGQSVRWTFVTGDAFIPVFAGETGSDLLNVDLSYAYRLHPETYGAVHEAAWYATAEFNGVYETNGDTELFLAPGLLIEAPRWAFETTVQLPVYRRVDERPSTNFIITLGVRFLF